MGDIYRNAIAQTFIELCEKKSLKNVTVKDIADECGINRQTFYNYFRDKYDVMGYLFNEATEMVSAPLKEGVKSVHDGMLQMLNIAQGNRNYYVSIARLEGQNSFAEVFQETSFNFFVQYIEYVHPEVDIDENLRFAIEFNCIAVTQVFIDWILSGMKKDPALLADQMYICMPQQLRELLR